LKKNNDGQRTIIFCETKRGVDDPARYLYKDRVHGVVAIHGSHSFFLCKKMLLKAFF
jgi:superfamily II DNA/RNA helicase